MNSLNIMNGTKNKLVPLISFYSIFDIDFGLINLICNEYLDKSVFNIDLIKSKDTKSIISLLYNRKDNNPLYCIANKDIDKNILDKYYEEFIDRKIQDIYNLSITTEVLNMIQKFNESQEITPIILCYSQEQIDVANEEPVLENNQKILFDNIRKKDLDTISQLYFKDINEAKPFDNLKYKTFYFSTYGSNFKDGDFRNFDLAEKILRNQNNISLFDIYKQELIEKEIDSHE